MVIAVVCEGLIIWYMVFHKLQKIARGERAAGHVLGYGLQRALTRSFPMQLNQLDAAFGLSGGFTVGTGGGDFAMPSFPPDHFSLVVAHTLFSSLARHHLHLLLLLAEIVALYICDGACQTDRRLYAALQTAELSSSPVQSERVPGTTNRIGLLQLTPYEAETSLRF